MRELREAAKCEFVDTAVAELRKNNSKVTVSRISAMCGIRRRDISDVYLAGPEPKESMSLASRVLAQWEQDPRFVTQSGKPRVLKHKGDDNEFQTLVESVSRDVNPATLLFELERIGALKKTSYGVKMLKAITYHHTEPEQGLEILSGDTESLVKAVHENIFEPQETRNLHLRTHYDNVFKEDLPHVRKWLLEQGQLFHKRARDFLSRYDKDINPNPGKEGDGQVTLVAFSLCEPTGYENEKTVAAKESAG